MAPAFTPGGHWLYFHSDRPGGCGPAGTFDLYVSHRRDTRDDFSWEPAVNLGCVVNSDANDGGPTFFHDRKTGTNLLYFTSTRPGGLGDYDIYVSVQDEEGTFGPATFVSELSSPARDTRTALRRDGLEMILSSGRPGGEGSEDLWVATREDTEDPWSAPVNLGAIVNSTAFDGAPALSRDGMTLYFFSDRPGGLGKRDLYVSTRRRLSRR